METYSTNLVVSKSGSVNYKNAISDGCSTMMLVEMVDNFSIYRPPLSGNGCGMGWDVFLQSYKVANLRKLYNSHSEHLQSTPTSRAISIFDAA